MNRCDMSKQLWLPSFFASGMILQQQAPCRLRGRSLPGAAIHVEMERVPFNGRPVSPLDSQYGLVADLTVPCDEQGDFFIDLPAFEASLDPFCLKISDGRQTRQFDGVLFGEVWIASGQANMQMPLGAVVGLDQLPGLANLHYVRILQQSATGLDRIHSRYGIAPADDLREAVWLRGDQPDKMSQVSAVAFSFARELHLELKIPVGVIETSLGESYIHSWIDRESIDHHKSIRRHVQELGFYRDATDWNMTGDINFARHQPAALFNSKIAPLHGLAARGLIWYQGEEDYQYPAYYRQALAVMLRKWNQVFRPAGDQGLFFLYVQLTPYYHGHHGFYQLAEFNEMLAAIRRGLPLPAGLITTYDLPPEYNTTVAAYRSSMYPTAKLPVGQRLKTVALGLVYQKKAPTSAPECSDIEVVGNKMLVSFSDIGDGLRLRSEEGRLSGFAICGPDHVYVEASARILFGLKVMAWHDQIVEPCGLTYAFADMNHTANLVSRDQLAVVPFRSDREPSKYWPPQEWMHCENLEVWSCPSYGSPDKTGWYPAWLIERGTGEISLEKANKSEGDGSLLFSYHAADGHEFAIEPQLQHDSMFPPLDLSYYQILSIDVFNSDLQIKHMKLAFSSGQPGAPLQNLPGRLNILAALRWQRLQFDLGNAQGNAQGSAQGSAGEGLLTSVRRLVFIIEDHKGKGSVYLDQIRFIRTGPDAG
jgi:sialate O-acetylesterase